MIEHWKVIPGTQGFYFASSDGRIKSVDRTVLKMSRWGYAVDFKCSGRILKPWSDANGYAVVYICANEKRQAVNVHRLVARAFHANENWPNLDVNHLDGNKKNNSYENLEWCTKSQNMQHAVATGLQKTGKPIIGKPIIGGPEIHFKNSKDAAIAIAPNQNGKGNIRSACNGKIRQAYGYFWRHA